MHVLHMPSWYSTADKPWSRLFVRDQARALNAAGVQSGIAFVERRSLPRFNGLNLAVSYWQTGMHDLLRRRFDPLAIRENARRRFGYPAIANRLCAVYERLLRHEHQEVA